MSNSNNAALLAGRILLSLIFILSALGKISDVGGTMGYMESAGVPGLLIYPTILVELLGGIALILGYQTTLVSIILAAFTLAAGVVFHHQLGDQMQLIMFLKNLAITGGFLSLFVSGPGQWSLDARRGSLVPATAR